MLPFEKRITDYLKKNAETVLLLLVTAGGIAGRFFLWDMLSSDLATYIKWYDIAKECGGLPGLAEIGQRVKSYNALFQLLMAAMTHIPVDPQYMYRIVWTMFDLILAWGVGRLVYDITGTGDRRAYAKAVFAYAFCFLAMDVIFNSSAWGQSDAVYVSMIVWSLVWLFRDRYLKAFIFLGIAFAFKLQTVFILPFFAFYYVYKKSFSCLYFLLVPGMLAVSTIPRTIAGIFAPVKALAADAAAEAITAPAVACGTAAHAPGVIDTYLIQIFSGNSLYMEYPSFWAFLPDTGAESFIDFYKFRNIAILVTMIILATIMLCLLSRKALSGKRQLLYAAMILSFTTVYFLPCMMDRYGYIFEILALALALLDKRSIAPAVMLHLVMYYQIAGRVGVETLPVTMQQLSLIMLLIYAVYIYLTFSCKKEDEHACI